MGESQLNELEKHGSYLSTPRGISMNPMLYEFNSIAEISLLDREPKRYDVVMYVRGDNNQGVIHRVLYKKDDIFVINGDNCWQKEYVKPEQIKGIVTRFYRNGKWHELNEAGYMIYVHIWTDLFFIRRPILYVRDKLKRLYKKLKTK